MRWLGVGDRWPSRSVIVGRQVPAGSSVIDLGAGAGGLVTHLPAGCTYTAADLPDFDMNRNRWPEGRWDVAVMAGVLEYARYPAAALRHLHELAPLAVVTYAHDPHRRDPAWVNALTPEDMEAIAAKAGFTARIAATWRVPHVRPQSVWILE